MSTTTITTFRVEARYGPNWSPLSPVYYDMDAAVRRAERQAGDVRIVKRVVKYREMETVVWPG